MKSINAKRTLIIVISGIGVVAIGFCVAFIFVANSWETRQREREENCIMLLVTPLPVNVVNDLCLRNLMPNHIAACDDHILQVKKQDTLAIISANVQIGISTYSDVTSKFGRYTNYCEDKETVTLNPTLSSFSCDYSLAKPQAGWQGWPIVHIEYNKLTKVVERILMPACGGGS